MKEGALKKPTIVRRAQRSPVFTANTRGFMLPARAPIRRLAIATPAANPSPEIKEERRSSAESENSMSRKSPASESEAAIRMKQGHKDREELGSTIRGKLEEAKSLRESALQEIQLVSPSLSTKAMPAIKDLSMEEIAQKKQQISDRVDSFLARSRVLSMEEEEENEESETPAEGSHNANGGNNNKKQSKDGETARRERVMERYRACKKMEKELLGLEAGEVQVDFGLAFGRRGELRSQPTYSVNYSKYMTDPEAFKQEESKKKKVKYYNQEEYSELLEFLRKKFEETNDETAMAIMCRLYPQLSAVFDSYLSFSEAFNYLFQNWRGLAAAANHSKTLKSTRAPALVAALLREDGAAGGSLEDAHDIGSQVSMKQEMDQVKEQLSEAETKIKEAQLKRLQKKLVSLKKELDDSKRVKDAEILSQTERLQRFANAAAFGVVFTTDYVGGFDYKKLVEAIRSPGGAEDKVITELTEKLDNKAVSFQKVFAYADAESLSFYSDAASQKELHRLSIKSIEITDLNLDLIDNEVTSALLLVGEVSAASNAPFFLLKVRESEMAKWAGVLGLQDSLTRKRVSKVRSEVVVDPGLARSAPTVKDSSSPIPRPPPAKEEPAAVVLPAFPVVEEEKAAPEIPLDDVVVDQQASESESEPKPKRLSPSVRQNLAPISEERDSGKLPSVQQNRESARNRSQDEESDSMRNALECPLDDLERSPGVPCLAFADSNDEAILTLDRAVEVLQSGFIFKKYGRYGQPHQRHVLLSEGRVVWKSIESNKDRDSVAVSEIVQIELGRTTPQFKRFPKFSKLEEASSFSIICSKRTVDLEASDPATRKQFVESLELLCQHTKRDSTKSPAPTAV